MQKSPFNLGDIVRHHIFGRGEVMMISGEFVKVMFNVGTDHEVLKKVHESTLVEEANE